MRQAQRNHYLEALGVPDFLYTQSLELDSSIKQTLVKCLVVESQANPSFCEAGVVHDFLLKMLGAIELSEADIMCINTPNEIDKYKAKVVLLMGDNLHNYRGKASIISCFSTHHPSQILTNELFKREAWEVLKKVQACLK